MQLMLRFVNLQQRKFYLLRRIFKIVNITAASAIMLLIIIDSVWRG